MWLAPELPRTRRALLADDDQELRMVVGEIITSYGFVVSQAGNGRKALQLFDEAKGRFDLLLTDISMPEMNGCELVREVRMRNPLIPIIVMSGSVNPEMVREIESRHAVLFRKPVNFWALHDYIDVLTGR